MNAVLRQAFADIAIGTPMHGGFYAGAYLIGDKPHGLIVAPRAGGDLARQIWHSEYELVEGARSFVDGLANTQAMAAAGSELAKTALAAEIGDLRDWYLPAQDELELLYRAFKPTSEECSNWARSGINVSALPPTYPYSAVPVMQTQLEVFRAGELEAFEPVAYWSSTQHADDGGYAWGQYFNDGCQDFWRKDGKYRARLVRRFAI